MPWIKENKDWLGKREKSEVSSQKPVEKQMLTVSEAAYELGVDTQTIRKYLALDAEDKAPIPFDAWYRLPGGHIRIYRWVILKMKN